MGSNPTSSANSRCTVLHVLTPQSPSLLRLGDVRVRTLIHCDDSDSSRTVLGRSAQQQKRRSRATSRRVTIAISLKVNDGIVLASDSATTVMAQPPGSAALAVINVYNNANKIVNLRKGSPIGAMTWGFGSIGPASISSLMKDLRQRFVASGTEWSIDPDSYTIHEVAQKLRRFFFEELYLPQFEKAEQKPGLGFIVAGYSAGAPLGEEYRIDIAEGRCEPPVPVRAMDESGVMWAGMPEAVTRLILGHGTLLPAVLQNSLSVPAEQVGQVMAVIAQLLQMPLVIPAMPIQDAIDLAEFLVETTIKFSRFMPGAPTVGGPVEIAAITKHEGFKWVRRKHYYPQELNIQDRSAP